MENDTLWHSTNSRGISARLNEAFGGLDGVEALTNNITVVAVCDTNQAALQDCRQKNIKLNKDKLKFKLYELSYMLVPSLLMWG